MLRCRSTQLHQLDCASSLGFRNITVTFSLRTFGAHIFRLQKRDRRVKLLLQQGVVTGPNTFPHAVQLTGLGKSQQRHP